VGGSKPSHYQLPPAPHTYGVPTRSGGPDKKAKANDEIPIKLVTNNWQEAKAGEEPIIGRKERDFVHLNRTQTAKGVATAKQSTRFRQASECVKGKPRGKSTYGIVLPEEDFRFGV
jgi:hypothetical protein